MNSINRPSLPPLYIRAEGDSTIGLGHLIRCLSLAIEWRNQGGDVQFITTTDNVFFITQCNTLGISVTKISNRHPNKEDLLSTIKIVNKRESENPILVLDGYMFDTEYHDQILKEKCTLLVIDDYHHLNAYHTHILLNQNIDSNKIEYHINQDSRQLLGPQFALLSNKYLEWKSWQREIPEKAKHLLVSIGGSDNHNITPLILRNLKDFPVKVKAILGPLNTHEDSIRHEFSDYDKIEILSAVNNMPEIMAWADIAITAGGSTVWELAFMGLPMLAVTTEPNQRLIVQGLHNNGMAVPFSIPKGHLSDNFKQELESLIGDNQKRRLMSNKSQNLIDGNGPKRVIEAILNEN